MGKKRVIYISGNRLRYHNSITNWKLQFLNGKKTKIEREMVLKELDFWENLKDYDSSIVSVFATENELTELISNIGNKNKKVVADFGCGFGNSFKYLKEFKRVYAVDYSKNMLENAKKKVTGNEILIHERIEKIEFDEKADISFAISSIIPNSITEFYNMIDSIIKNTKKEGQIILTLASFESRIFSIQLDADYMFNHGEDPAKISKILGGWEIKGNFSASGYLISKIGKTNLIQKQWVREELLFRLQRYDFKKVEIVKLNLDWDKQLKKKGYIKYPNLWLWLVKIDI